MIRDKLQFVTMALKILFLYLEAVGAELAPQERVYKINIPNHVDKEQELGEVEARRPDGVGVQRAHQVAGERAQLARALVAAGRLVL